MRNEIWTAERIEEKDGEEMIVFSVNDKSTGETREEQRYKSALPLLMTMGGYPPQMGIVLASQELPWRFHWTGNNIYIDGPSVGADDYHPIGD
jgi:hypothetical protein